MKTKDYNPPMTKEERRMYQEINRYYDSHYYDEKLCKARSLGMCQNAGRFYIVDTLSNTLLYINVDIERLQNEIKEKKTTSNLIHKTMADFKMIQEMEASGHIKDLNHFKLRAECIQDILLFMDKLGETLIGFKIERDFFPDVEFEFFTNLTKDEILSVLSRQDDSHVMLDTLRPFNEYTGER